MYGKEIVMSMIIKIRNEFYQGLVGAIHVVDDNNVVDDHMCNLLLLLMIMILFVIIMFSYHLEKMVHYVK